MVQVQPPQTVTVNGDFSRDQVELIKSTICKGATDDELKLFLQVCKSKKLDPFSKQIHAIKRPTKVGNNWVDVMTFQIGIDGFRAIAERTGRYEGQTQPLWCGEDGEWKDVWLSNKQPAAAKVGVYKTVFREPLVRTALYREYVQTAKDRESNEYKPNSMWAKMPANQLAKCAEALALRAAFPEELSGLYTHEEMAQADNYTPDQPEPITDERTLITSNTMMPAQPNGTSTINGASPKQDPDKPWNTRGEMAAKFTDMRQRYTALNFGGVYETTLREFGVAAAEKFSDATRALECYRALVAGLEGR